MVLMPSRCIGKIKIMRRKGSNWREEEIMYSIYQKEKESSQT